MVTIYNPVTFDRSSDYILPAKVWTRTKKPKPILWATIKTILFDNKRRQLLIQTMHHFFEQNASCCCFSFVLKKPSTPAVWKTGWSPDGLENPTGGHRWSFRGWWIAGLPCLGWNFWGFRVGCWGCQVPGSSWSPLLIIPFATFSSLKPATQLAKRC